MARGRMLNKKISLNRWVAQIANELGGDAALAYTWAISHLDRDGRITGDPKTLCAQVAPMVSGVTPEVVGGMLELAAKLELIVLYEVGREWFVEYPKFKQNQQGMRYDREAESTIPAPPEPTPDLLRSPPDVVRQPPDQVRQLPAEGKVREGNGREEKARQAPCGAANLPALSTVPELQEEIIRRKWGVGISPAVVVEAQRLLNDGPVTRDVIEYAAQLTLKECKGRFVAKFWIRAMDIEREKLRKTPPPNSEWDRGNRAEASKREAERRTSRAQPGTHRAPDTMPPMPDGEAFSDDGGPTALADILAKLNPGTTTEDDLDALLKEPEGAQ